MAFQITSGQVLAETAGGATAVALVDYGAGQVVALSDVTLLANVGWEMENLQFWQNLAKYAGSR